MATHTSAEACLGSRQFWGTSAASRLSGERICSIGACDGRHVLRTWYEHAHGCTAHGCTPQLHATVVETHADLVARQMVMFCLLTDSSLGPPHSRAAYWLEVLGNVTLRARTAEAFASAARKLCDALFASDDGATIVLPIDGGARLVLDLGGVKHAARDELVAHLDLWARGAGTGSCERAARAWDDRMRRVFGERYDVRENLVDWDAVMGLGSLLAHAWPLEYRKWRLTGIAFDFEADASADAEPRANLSLISGSTKAPPVWLGDSSTSPLVAYGADGAWRPELCIPIAVPHESRPKHSLAEIAQQLMLDVARLSPPAGATLHVRFLFSADLAPVLSRLAAAAPFDSVALAATCMQHLGAAAALLAPGDGGPLIVETCRFMLALDVSHRAAYVDRVRALAASSGLVELLLPLSSSPLPSSPPHEQEHEHEQEHPPGPGPALDRAGPAVLRFSKAPRASASA